MKNLFTALTFALTLSACSNRKEECHAIALSAADIDNIQIELRAAAKAGNRADFEKLKVELLAAGEKLKSVEVTGDSPLDKGRASRKTKLIEGTTEVSKGFEAVLAAMEAHPNTATALQAETEERLSEFFSNSSVSRKMTCD